MNIGSGRKTFHLFPAAWSHRRLALAALVLGLLLVVLSPFRLALVVGASMEPGFRTGDLLLVNKRIYRSTDPQRGDVVLARRQKELIIKRVVGLPGEEVQVSQGRVYINGVVQPELYPLKPGRLDIGSGKLLRGKYALVGDNRAVTVDEAVHAVLPKERILGKVIMSWRIWPGR